MSDLNDLIESEILMKMCYPEFIPLNCLITKINSDYYISNTSIKETRIFVFKKENSLYRIVPKESIYDSDEWSELSDSNLLSDLEKLMLTALMFGNKLLEDKIPSKTIDKIHIKTSITNEVSPDISLTI